MTECLRSTLHQYWILSAIVAATLPQSGRCTSPAPHAPIGHIEPVAAFRGPMPTGVTVSKKGRIFVNFPRWGDNVEYTVGEWKNGHTVPYPSAALNRLDEQRPAMCLVSVQSVVVDAKDRLWILDTGTIKMGPVLPGGPKLVAVDLKTDDVVCSIPIPITVALPTSYLNDVRFDLTRGKGGLAFITDSTGNGPNGIVVVEIGTAKSWRCLSDHPSTKAEKDFLPQVEGEPMMVRPEKGEPRHMTIGSDGIAISPDGKRLYYSALSARRLYSVSVDALANSEKSDVAAATVKDLGFKPASDGLECDTDDCIYASDYEHNAIVKISGGHSDVLVSNDAMLWPDTLSLAQNGYLYFTANQLHRQALFHMGKDLRKPPYMLYRVRVKGKPILRK